MDLFTYGTLMSPDIMARVAGCRLTSETSRLAGYKRTLVRDEVYPGIVEAAGHEVDGVLYLDVPEAAIRRLDAFEGEMYDRCEVSVTVEGGAGRTAMTYVFRQEYRYRLTDILWDYKQFLASGKDSFENGYSGFGVVD